MGKITDLVVKMVSMTTFLFSLNFRDNIFFPK